MKAIELIDKLSKVSPDPFDQRLMDIKSKDVVCPGSTFDHDIQVIDARRFVWCLAAVQRQHRSLQWREDRIYQLVKEFAKR